MKRYPLLFIWLMLFLGSLNNFINTNRNGQELSFEIGGYSTVQKTTLAEDSSVQQTEKSVATVFKSRQTIAGKIGVSEKQAADNPFDNVFEVFIDQDVDRLLSYRLKYELFGVTATGVVRSINDELAYGGQLVVLKNEWQPIEETLHADQLKQGKNIVRFSIPDGANYSYTVRDIKIVTTDKRSEKDGLTVFGPYLVGEKVYMRGFVGSECEKVLIDDEAFSTQSGAFEFVGPSKGKKQAYIIETATAVGKQTKTAKVKFHADKADEYYEIVNNAICKTVMAKKDEDWVLQLDGIKLTALKGSVDADKSISVTTLRAMDMAPMGPGMINVTAFAAGYRLLPHDSKFLNNLQISLGIDSTKLPRGYSPKQVRTYFFDEATNKWTVLQKDTIQANGMYASAITDHFTDFINAIIKQPELPTSQAYTPTMFSDLKAANPLEGVNTISPPSANNNGTVNISLPIVVPLGRQGLQPQLALQYSSEGGNGWLGLGWGLSIPSISVDTRWGVPNYHTSVESESYMMGGDELQWVDENDSIRPLFHRGAFVPRNSSGHRRFIKRVEGSFNRIIRHGNTPATFWWEVRDKNGTSYYYGKYYSDAGPNSNCILEMDGKIAFWALAEVRDINGNFIKYTYNRSTGSGKYNDTNAGRQLLISQINYTGFADGTAVQDTGTYTVNFASQTGHRPDTSINLRYGFKEVTDKLLSRIDVNFNGVNIRSYQLGYNVSSFQKSTLCYVLEANQKTPTEIVNLVETLHSENICNDSSKIVNIPAGFKIHRFEYFKAPVEKKDSKTTDLIPFSGPYRFINAGDLSSTKTYDFEAFDANTLASIGKDYSFKLGGLDNIFQQTPLGMAQSFSIGGNASLYLGVGPQSQNKKNSVNGSYSYQWSNSRAFSTMMDVDGDGYPDRVFEKVVGATTETEVLYQRMIFSDTNKFVPVFLPPVKLDGIKRIQTQRSHSHSWGLQGVLGITEAASASASAGYGRTKSITSSYFADVNGDGLVDYVNNDADVPYVLINKITPQGTPEFSIPTNDTLFIGGSCEYVVRSGHINDSVLLRSSHTYEGVTFYDDVMQKHQAVRVWYAPFDGVVSIYAPIMLKQNPNVTPDVLANLLTADGVRFALQHNATQIYNEEIQGGDFNVYKDTTYIRTVNRGDRLFFRLTPKDYRTHDDVEWNPIITYNQYNGQTVSSSILDANGKPNFVYDANDDYFPNQKQHILMPDTGNVQIQGVLNTAQISDEVKFQIWKSGQLIHQHVIAPYSTGSHNFNFSTSVVAEEPMEFKAVVNSRVSYEKIDYQINVDYLTLINGGTTTLDPNNEYERVRLTPQLQFDILADSYQPSLPISIGTNTTVELTPRLQLGSNVNGVFTMSVKTSTAFITKKTFEIVNGALQTDSVLTFQNNGNNQYYVDFNLFSEALNANLLSAHYKLNANGIQILTPGVYSVLNPEMMRFGNLYRGWGQFVYNEDELSAINETSLVRFPTIVDTTDIVLVDSTSVANMNVSFDNNFTTTGISNVFGSSINDILDAPFYSMEVDIVKNRWVGMGYLTSVNAMGLSNSLPAEDFPSSNEFNENPLPRPIGAPGAKFTSKETFQNTWNLGASIGPSIINGSASGSLSFNRATQEFIDLNGDRFPDVVGEVYTQYTLPFGGINPYVMGLPNSTVFDKGINRSWSWTLGAGIGGSNNREEVAIPMVRVDRSTGSVGANGSGGQSLTEYTLLDINGDGLPDRVDRDGKVQLNSGYGFLDGAFWNTDGLNVNNFGNGGLSVGNGLMTAFKETKDKWEGSWSLGVGRGIGWSNIKKNYIDINGDGLVDIIYATSTGLEVSLNTGNGFIESAVTDTGVIDGALGGKTHSLSGNVSGTYGVPIPPGILKVGGSLGLNFSISRSFDEGQFIDVNNDGYVDVVRFDSAAAQTFVYYSQVQKVNLLKRVTSSVGSSFDISYRMLPSNDKMPQSKWVMDTVCIRDGLRGDGIDTSKTSFEYKGGYYNRFERVFLGYDTVITRQHRANGSTYRSIVEHYHTNDFLFKGMMYAKVIKDSANHVYNETVTMYGKHAIDSGTLKTESNLTCFGPYFPAVYKEQQRFYEDGNQPIVVTKRYTYGRYGNVIAYYSDGDSTVGTDSLKAVITYNSDSLRYLIGLPTTISVYDSQNNIIRSRAASYDIIGRLVSIGVNLGNGVATTTLEHDQYGNVEKMTLPPNSLNQQVYYQYTYDDTLNIYPTTVSDVYGYSSSTQYNLLFGKPTETIDISGSQVKYFYNPNGRLNRIQGPKEIANSQPFTLQFTYWDDDEHPFPSQGNDTVTLWAKTEHYDAFNQGNTISTILFSDGLGRVVQTKKKSVVLGTEEMVVSGRTLFDEFGRSIAQFYPSTEGLATETVLNPYWNTTANPTRITYDVLDRPILEKMPDDTETETLYGFGTDAEGKKRFKKTITDANNISVSVLTDHRDLQIKVEAPLSANTNFKYNALGELIASKDPEGNITSYTYDLAGRRTSRNHPDAGVTNWTYDNASNLIHMATANLTAMSQQVNYVYYFGQLKRIEYPQNPENNVHYEYGQSGFETGRISKSQDASGVHAYEYGNMGELVKKTSTGVVPTMDGEAYSFATRWQYDSWNRIRSINYPDGEVVEYDYDNGGQLIHMQGTKSNVQTYVSNIEYDEFGSRTYFEYGNGVSTMYNYNAATRRLQTLTTTATNGNLHNITYTYDPVGNITNITNAATGADGLGGSFTYNYSYDELYRLAASSGGGNTDDDASYTLAMAYSPSGNILQKTLSATKQLLGNSTYDSYSNEYTYSGAHTLANVNDLQGGMPSLGFAFDGNGNMVMQQLYDLNNGTNERYLCWDEENRLSATRDNNYVTANIYDASGNRSWKLAGEMNWMWQNGSGWQGYGDLNLRTWYQSELMTITDVGFTKHYFIAGQRIASKLGESLNNADVQPLRENHVEPLTENYKVLNQGAAERMKRDFECLGLDYNNFTPGEPVIRVLDELAAVGDADESNIYFYHSDHLGSSSFLTDGGGVATQHLQYMPFGEDLVHQQNTAAYYTPYTFSGKERDFETGLSYFGARYYDAGLSIWLSVDPMSDKYPSLSAYNYCAWNPVMLVDPDGREIEGDPQTKNQVQVVQRFEFDLTPSGKDKPVGTDFLTQTEVSTTINNGVQTRTTVVTSMSVGPNGEQSETANRFAFTESGTGENRQYAQTPVESISLDKVQGPLKEIAHNVSQYKQDNGVSNLQTRADNLNLGAAITTSTAASFIPMGSGAVKLLSAISIGAATSVTQPFSPENLLITY